jgi:hypothetical protein
MYRAATTVVEMLIINPTSPIQMGPTICQNWSSRQHSFVCFSQRRAKVPSPDAYRNSKQRPQRTDTRIPMVARS